MRGEDIVDQCSAYAGNLVRGDGCTDATAAERHCAVNTPRCNSVAARATSVAGGQINTSAAGCIA